MKEMDFGLPKVSIGPEMVDASRFVMGNAGLIRDTSGVLQGLMVGSFVLAGFAAVRAWQCERANRRNNKEIDAIIKRQGR